MNFIDLVTVVGVVAAAIGTIYAALAYHRPKAVCMHETPEGIKNRRRTFLVVGLVLVGWGAVAVNYFQVRVRPPVALLQMWGMLPPATYTITVDSSQILQYKDKFKLILITRTGFSDVDRLTDEFIEKSNPYTIDGGVMAMAHPSENKLRYLIERPTVVEYDLTMLPNQFSGEQIKNLQDVEKLGGKILSSVSQTITIPHLPATAPPPNCGN